ncbi:MAG: hypothetical protein M3N47_06230, partial [Chloroflexota bacterium]|nr:hypothetical protein [Chloroflexota bacterium]
YFTIFEDMEYWLGVSPEGVGAIGMVINFAVTIAVSLFTKEPSREVQDLVEEVRHPRIAPPAAPAASTAAPSE